MATAEATADEFGEDFGQKVDLTARIREILRDYPEGTSIFKELVQNADDAGASEICFILDCRSHGTQSVWAPALAQFQHAALLVYNNSIFTKKDFESIQSIGSSLKKTGEEVKTGRFGVGFNSVYHLTDLPQFISDEFMIFFDPQATHLPHINPSNPGKIVNFVKNTAVIEKYNDQFKPMEGIFGCNLTQPFQGTTFRLPLRSPAQAKTSKLAQTPRTPELLWKQLCQFGEQSSGILLFLKHIERIRIMKIDTNGSSDSPQCYYDCCVVQPSSELKKKRAYAGAAIRKTGATSSTGTTTEGASALHVDYQLRLRLTVSKTKGTTTADTNGNEEEKQFKDERTTKQQSNNAQDIAGAVTTTEETWAVYSQLGGGFRAQAIAADPNHKHLRLVPWAGVAACLRSLTTTNFTHPTDSTTALTTTATTTTALTTTANTTTANIEYPSIDGSAYCFLPLPVSTRLPVHVNGYFELSSNRRDILHGDDLQGIASSRAQWNESLLEEIAAPCLLRLIEQQKTVLGLQPDQQQLDGYYQLFPHFGGSWIERLS